MNPAPILLFTYKRLDALKATVASLQENRLAKDSELFIFSDGPKKASDIHGIEQVRKYLKTISGFKKVTVEEAPKNKGLANSVIDGVTQIIKMFDRVIVIEDDLLLTPNFLHFMNAALECFQGTPRAFSISGYSFDLGIHSQKPDTYFINRGWSWGWATWKDRWNEVDWDVTGYELFQADKLQKKEFAKGGSDLNKMLQHQMQGKLDSWAIRWFYHQFKVGGLTLYPVYSKVYNNGFDIMATHTNGSDRRYRPLLDKVNSTSFNFPEKVEINPYYQKKFQIKMGIKARIKSKLETYISKLVKK